MKKLLTKTRLYISDLAEKSGAMSYEKKGLLAIFIILFIVALGVRYRLLGVVTPDFTDFLQPWSRHLAEDGLRGLGDDFSNYNTPYLVLLWLASFLPFSDLVSVKLISIFFDLVLATSVFFVIRHFRPTGIVPYAGFLAILFAPTVIQNGSMWGQCDALYTSFIVWAFYAYMKGRLNLAWILWGVAFAFKLQAIFFAPFLLFMTFYHRKAFLGPVYAGIVLFLLSALPLFYGKSLIDIAGVYIGQTAPIRTDWGLAWFAPTAYQWVSNAYFEYVRQAGMLFGGAIALAGVALAFVRKYSQQQVLVIATLLLLAVPFFMPTIHERYMFSAEIFLIITAFVIPKFFWAAIGMQIVTTMAYLTYFTQGNQDTPIPFAWLSVFVFIIIYSLATYLYKTPLLQARVRPSLRLE